MITRYRNIPVRSLASEIDRLFNTPFAPLHTSTTAFSPAINVWHDENALHAEAELPGFVLDDVEVTVDADALTIRGQRTLAVPENATLLHAERTSGRFERSFALPFPIDPEKAVASLHEGVLSITVPKADAARIRRIALQAGPRDPDTTTDDN